METKRYIGIMVPTLKLAEILKTYVPYQLNACLYAFTPRNINWKNGRIYGLEYVDEQWQRRSFPFPNAIYNCCYGDKRKLIRRLEARIGRNKSFNALNCYDKGVIHRILFSSNLRTYLPESHLYSRGSLATFLQNHHIAFIKARYGSRGRGIFRVEKKPSGEYVITKQTWDPIFVSQDPKSFYTQLEKHMGSKRYLIQKEISLKKYNNHFIDMRVMVQKDSTGKWTVTGDLVRFANRLTFVSNFFRNADTILNVLKNMYDSPERASVIYKEICDVCLGVAHTLDKHYGHLGELGIDIAVDNDDKIWVIEVNGAPSKYLFINFEKPYIDVLYQTTVDYASFLASFRPVRKIMMKKKTNR